MPNQRPTQQQQQNAGSTHQPTSAQPLAPSDQANGQAQHASHGTATSQRDTDKAKTVRERRAQNWLLVIFTGLVVVVTSVYAYFSYGQWDSMDKSVAETRKNRELEYRAYVGAKAALFQPRPDNPAWGNVVLVTINTGRTPARDGRIRHVLEHRDAPPPDETVINEMAHPVSKTLYIPSIEYNTVAGMIPTSIADTLLKPPTTPSGKTPPKASPQPTPTPIIPSLTPPEGMKIGDGAYLYGIIDYTDIFDKPHSTRFCFYIAPGGSDFVQCPTFNDSN